MRRARSARRGGTLVEFALVLVLLLGVTIAGLEFDRMLMVSTSLANAARVGVRYAIVHGGNRSVGGSGATDKTRVIDAVTTFARIGFLKPDLLNVQVEYPAAVIPGSSGNSAGSTVIVTVTYPYDALTWLPISGSLSATSRGIIVF
jgi:Flp pilus assembly protein TadG